MPTQTSITDNRPKGVTDAEQARDIACAREEWEDAQARLSDYLNFCAQFERPLNHDTVRTMQLEQERCQREYLNLVGAR